MRLLLTALLLASLPAHAVAPEAVRLVKQHDPACTFVIQKTCSTIRSNGLAICENWHRAQAAKVGADVFEVVAGGQVVQGSGYGSTYADTSMTADYYKCGS